jgi:riboflavin kinase/FMN adenylyltransferase
MRIITYPSEAGLQGAVVSIGMFDGVHRGHRRVLRELREQGRERRLPTVVITFDPHPRAVLRPDARPVLLSSLEDRMGLLAMTGSVDYCLVLPFDRQRSGESADDFVQHTLVDGLGMHALVVGENFACGSKRSGTIDYLRGLGASKGFTVLPVPLHETGARKGATHCSSTETRRLIQAGDIASAAAMLERPHELCGTVLPAGLGARVMDVALPCDMCTPPSGDYAGAARKKGSGAAWIAATLQVRGSGQPSAHTVRLYTEGDAGVASGDLVSLRFLDQMQRLGNQRAFSMAVAA